MTDDRMLSMSDDEFDAQIKRYLSWEINQVRGAPAGEVVASRIAVAVDAKPLVPRPVLVWAAILMALLIAAGALLVAGGPDPDLVVVSPSVPATSPSALATLPTAGPSRAPIAGAGPCRDGRIDIKPVDGFVELPPAAEQIRHSSDGRIAMALETTSTSGVIVVTVLSPMRLQAIATFTGEDVESPAGVQVLSWSPNGDALLVLAQSRQGSDPEQTCGNYFVVRTDGSAVHRLTDYGPDEKPGGAVFSPSGTSITYTLGSVVHVVALSGESRSLPVQCLGIHGALRWTQDESSILVQCNDGGILIVEVASGQARWLPLDPGPLDARWTSDDQGIVVAVGDDVPGLTGGPLSILDVDVADLSFTTRVRSTVSTEWVLGVPSLAPDARRLLVQGGGEHPELSYYPTYFVATASGTTTELPWPVMPDTVDPAGRQPVVTWLPGYERVLTVQDGTLYEIDLERITRMDVGTVPALDYAWLAVE